MASTPEPTLLGLPAETLVDISGQVPKQDLISLRQCCRELEAASHDAFRHAFFTTRNHTYTRYGLQALADIATHSSLGRKVNKVAFVVTQLNERHYGPNKYPFCVGTPPPELRVTKEDEERQEREADAAWETWVQEAHAFSKDGLNMDLLCLTLRTFVDMGVHPTLVVTDDTSWTYGFKHLKRQLGLNISSRALSSGKGNAAIQSIFSAVATTHFPVQALELGESGAFSKSLNASAFLISDQLRPNLDTCLQTLRTLHLELGYRIDDWPDHEYAAFSRTMGAATNLASLHLAWDGYEAQPQHTTKDILNFVGDAITSTQLTHIRLNGIQSNAASFIAFLARRRDSLKNLELWFTAVPDTDCWSKVLRWMVSSLSLEELLLCTLRLTEGFIWGYCEDEYHVDDNFRFSGGEDVKEGMIDLVETATYWAED